MTFGKDKILELKKGALWSHSPENSLCKRFWTCDRTDYVMMMMMMFIIVVIVVVVVAVVVELNVQRVLQMKSVA